jgi:hypothetical protein
MGIPSIAIVKHTYLTAPSDNREVFDDVDLVVTVLFIAYPSVGKFGLLRLKRSDVSKVTM